VELTRPAKLLFPEDGLTKGDLIEYYRRIAPWMLPHVRGRPLAMERYPDGIDTTRIFQKDVPPYYPDWIKTVRSRRSEELSRTSSGITKLRSSILRTRRASLPYLAQPD
jgi:bifunctional non-homologous end joining protein LigD